MEGQAQFDLAEIRRRVYVGVALELVNLIVGVASIVYALVAHLILPGIPFVLMIVSGALLIVSACQGVTLYSARVTKR